MRFRTNSHETNLHAGVALAADRGQELLEAVLAVQVTLLLDETDVGQRALAVAVVADEVIRAPDATQSGDEWSSVKGESVIRVRRGLSNKICKEIKRG